MDVKIQPVQHLLDGLDFTWINKPPYQVCWVCLEERMPAALIQWVNDLNIGGVRKRMIVRKLSPYQGIAVHTDEWMMNQEDWRRFQIPFKTHPDIVMRWPEDDEEVHLEAGYLWEVDYTRPHEVINNTASERIHIQIDQQNAEI